MKKAEPSIFRFDQLVSKPWPNGRGMTRDVASSKSPTGSIDWLISIAELVEDAAFSHYAGCNRILTIIQDNPIDLHIDDAPPLRCNRLIPTCFPGDRPTRCSLIGGPTRAFNVFINRKDMLGTVSCVEIAGAHEIMLPRQPAAVHCVSGTVMAQGTVLRRGDTLIEASDRILRTEGTAATALIVDLQIAPHGAGTF